MKCSNCGHELEPGSGFCENCGMIISLDGDENIQQTPSDIYSAEPFEAESEQSPVTQNGRENPAYVETESPRELEADATEQIVPVFEYPEKEDETENVAESEPEAEQQPELEQKPDRSVDNSDIYAADSLSETTEFEEDEDEYEKQEQDATDYGQPEEPYNDEEQDTAQPEDEQTEEDISDDGEPDEEDGLDDMYVTSSKSKKNSVIIAVLIVALIAVTAGGAVMIKDNFSKVPVNALTSETQTTAAQKESATTKKAPETEKTEKNETTDEATEETTGQEPDEQETTAENEQAVTEPSEENTTGKPDVTEDKTPVKENTTKRDVSTTKSTTAAKPTTTRQVVTNPPTTKPITTTKPTTTKPTTTKPTTTKPTATKPETTTDPYGFGTDKVQKPGAYLAAGARYTVYVNVSSLTMRSKPDQQASKVVYVSIGEDLTVYGKEENGFLYVRSNRYGVYGWVAERYVSKTRPTAEETVVVPGIVKPDKKYSSPKTMYVNVHVGIRLRKAPETDAASVRTLSYGFPVKVTGYSSADSGWVYVTDITHGVTGWTRLEWLAEKQ